MENSIFGIKEMELEQFNFALFHEHSIILRIFFFHVSILRLLIRFNF